MDLSEFEIRNKDLEQEFTKTRSDWSSKIYSLIQKLKNIGEIVDAQVLMLSYRHELSENIAKFKHDLIKIKTVYDSSYKKSYIKYKTDYDIKLNGGETNTFVNSDLNPLKNRITMIEIHLEYLNNCKDTLDNVGFAIKRRIDLSIDFG